MTYYRLSSSWRVETSGVEYELYGGEDARFLVPQSDFLVQLAQGEKVLRPDSAQQEAMEFEKLVSARVIQPVTVVDGTAVITYMGDNIPSGLSLPIGSESSHDNGLLVVIRHTSAQADIVREVAELESLHLYVDISFHHTISIGPLVVPHETPCIGCLYGRVRERWGERQPVAQPEVVTENPELTSALISSEIRRCVSGDTSLVGQTVAWNLAERSILKEKLLTVPSCPYCRDFTIAGRVC